MTEAWMTDDVSLLAFFSVYITLLHLTRHVLHIWTYLKIDITESDTDCDKELIGPISHSLTCNEPARSLLSQGV